MTHVNVWQKTLQYCKVISLQLIKITGKKIELDLTPPPKKKIRYLRGGCNGPRRSLRERSYPSPKVRAPGCNSPGATERSFPTPEARGGGREELSHLQGVAAAQLQEGREELLHVQFRSDGSEEIPLVQGKEQQLHFAGAAMKRYPTSRVRETQVRW